MTTVFYIAAAVAVASTLMVITRLNAVHALLYLVGSLLSVAVMFFALGAPFVAVLEVIVYGGAIMVLFVFVVMMLGLDEPREGDGSLRSSLRAWAGPVVLSLVLLAEFVTVLLAGAGTAALAPPLIPPRDVGRSLFTTYALGVELASMLLLAAAVGAFHLGRRIPPSSEAKGEGGSA